MKYLIYYIEEEKSARADIEHLLEEDGPTEESIDTYLQDRWSSFIPMIPTSGRGATKEEAREDAIRNAYSVLSHSLELRQLQAKDFASLTFEDSPEVLTGEQLGKMGPQFYEPSEDVAAE